MYHFLSDGLKQLVPSRASVSSARDTHVPPPRYFFNDPSCCLYCWVVRVSLVSSHGPDPDGIRLFRSFVEQEGPTPCQPTAPSTLSSWASPLTTAETKWCEDNGQQCPSDNQRCCCGEDQEVHISEDLFWIRTSHLSPGNTKCSDWVQYGGWSPLLLLTLNPFVRLV